MLKNQELSAFFRPLIAAAVLISLAIVFGDRIGLEGDDLAIMEGAAHLHLKPRDTLYRYPWQPLAFFAAHGLTQLGVTPLALTYLPNVLGAIGIVLLAEALLQIMRVREGIWMAYCLVLAVPELWITSLYFNTTALGLPFFSAAVLLLALPVRDERTWFWRVAASATTFVIACLLRLDFAATSLALVLIVYCETPSRKWSASFFFMVVSGITGVTVLFSLGVEPFEALGIIASLEVRPQPAWRSGLTCLLAILPLVLMAPFLMGEVMRRKWPHQPPIFWTLVALSALPMLYPLQALYSAKYLIPVFCCTLVGLAFLLRQPPAKVADKLPGFRGAHFAASTLWFLAGVLLISAIFGVQVDPTARRVSGAFTASTFGTDDGVRPIGGYLSFLYSFRGAERPPYILLNYEIAGWIERSPGDAIVVLRETYDAPDKQWRAPLVNSWAWGWPTLYLQERGWVVENYVERQRIAMKAPDGRKAYIITHDAAEVDLPSHECIIEIGPVRVGREGKEDRVHYATILSKGSCKP
jgi:hypothetical protein